MFKLMGKKMITILFSKRFLYLTYDNIMLFLSSIITLRLHAFLSSVNFFLNYLKKNLSGVLSDCQTVGTRLGLTCYRV